MKAEDIKVGMHFTYNNTLTWEVLHIHGQKLFRKLTEANGNIKYDVCDVMNVPSWTLIKPKLKLFIFYVQAKDIAYRTVQSIGYPNKEETEKQRLFYNRTFWCVSEIIEIEIDDFRVSD